MELFETGFWNAVRETAGLDVGLWQRPALALAILAAFVLIRRPLARLFVWFIRSGASRLFGGQPERIDRVLLSPATLIPLAAGLFVAARVLQLEDWADAAVGDLVRSLGVLATTLVLAGALRELAPHRLPALEALGQEMVGWGLRLLEILIWLFAAAAILEIWGIRVAPILASLGLLGVAVALGAQDFFKNLISGLVVLTERRYRIGDRVQLQGVVDGSVERIGFRSTRVRLFDGAPVSVPNAMLADGALVNYGEIPWRRILWTLTLEYGTTAEQLIRVRDEIRIYLRDCGDFVPSDQATQEVRLEKFADSSIDIMIYAFVHTNQWVPWLEAKERLLMRIKEIVESAGASFAFPSRSLYIEKTGPTLGQAEGSVADREAETPAAAEPWGMPGMAADRDPAEMAAAGNVAGAPEAGSP